MLTNQSTTLYEELIRTENPKLALALIANQQNLVTYDSGTDSLPRYWEFVDSDELRADIALFKEEALSVNAHMIWDVLEGFFNSNKKYFNEQ